MLEIRLLGQFDVRLDGQPVEIGSRPVRLLLAYLALNPGIDHPREDLAARLWPEADPVAARNNLRNVLYKLREALKAGPQRLRSDNETVSLHADGDLWSDVAVLRERRPTGPLATDDLIAAVSVYQGRLLPGFNDNWVDVERMHLREAFERRMESLLRQLEAEQRWAELRDWSDHWVARVEHTPEAAYRGLMMAYAGLGEFALMEAAYKACASALKKELNDPDWEPSEATQALYETLRRRRRTGPFRPAAVPAEPPAAPPAEARPRLPRPATPFIGRERELGALAERLADPACRLITLVGPGGIGKTRLAVQAAGASSGLFADGVYCVSLAAVESADAVVAAVADELGMPFSGRERPRRQLVDYLRERQALLVLDNFEHLLGCADLVDEIVQAAPAVKVLATSRERLRLPDEWLLDIDGLDVPASADAPGAETRSAVQLFLQTARRLYGRLSLSDDLAAIVHLCRLVDGLPLAIEMAAAWVRVLPVREIVAQIEHNLSLLARPLPHLPARQHSVRAVFEHSWRLLSEAEQRVFRRLAAFPGGFRREAAEAVAGAPLALLLSLVDKSFLRRDADGRFTLHELLRQYAAEKLREAAEAPEVETRLAHHFLEHATLHRGRYAELEPEWDNLAGGLRAAHRHGLHAVVLGYAEALGDAWLARNRLSEARAGYAWACAAAEALDHPRGLAAMLCRWGRACLEQSDFDEAAAHLARSLAISREQADEAGCADALDQLGCLAIEKAEFAQAEAFYAECLALRQALQDPAGEAQALYGQARTWFYLERHADVLPAAERAAQMQAATGRGVCAPCCSWPTRAASSGSAIRIGPPNCWSRRAAIAARPWRWGMPSEIRMTSPRPCGR